jgi:DNA-binding response OmpR family regulator
MKAINSRDLSRVLIIDDEKNIIESISSFFPENEFKILSSTNADQAMLLIHEERPLILTLDLRMFDSNGIEILKTINDLGFNKKIWIIVISGAKESELQAAVDFGADFYLQKPFHENDLNKIIKKLSVKNAA